MTLLTKENFLKNNEIIIGEALWNQIMANHNLDDIADYMHNLIIAENIPFPYVKINPLSLKDSFSELKNLDTYSLIKEGKWENSKVKIDYPFTFNGKFIYIGKSRIGRPCSNYFFQELRMEVDIEGKNSPLNRWTNPKHRKMFKFLEHRHDVDHRALLACLTFYGSMATQFSTSSAKILYEITQARNILDFCGGWGDRLTGAIATKNVISYTGIDPNTSLHPKYEALSKFYKHNKKTKFICSPAEDVEFEPNQFDVIFTSPPYFDLEIYSYEETQSSSRYKNIDSWLEGFLFKVINKCYTWLEADGRLLLNISDFRGIYFCQKMIEYAISIGFKFEGIIGYEISQRPGTNQPLDITAGEPIFIFSKGNPPDLILESQNTLF